MRSHEYRWLAALLVLWVGAGCAPEKPSDKRERAVEESAHGGAGGSSLESEPVVVVDGEETTLSEFERRVHSLPEYARARYSTTDRRQSYLDSIAKFEVMADRAERAGLGERREVLDALEEALAEHVVAEVIREEASEEETSEEAIEAYYDGNRREFEHPEARRVALIKADERDYAERLRRRVLDEIDEEPVVDFRKAAARYSVDKKSAADGGDIGFVDHPRAEPESMELAEAIFELDEPGELTPVVEFDGGYAVATFIDQRAATEEQLEAVAAQIRRRLEERAGERAEEEFIDALTEKNEVALRREVVEQAEKPELDDPIRPDEIPLEEVAPFESERASRTEQTDDP